MGLALSLLGLAVVGAVIGFGVYFLITNVTIKDDKDE
jgi:uncharacterized protein (UPF0333 family)